MRHTCVLLLSLAVSGLVLAPGLCAEELPVKAEGYRLRLPDGFQAAPSSRGGALQSQVQAMMSSSGLPLSGTPSVRVFLRFGTNEPATLVVLCYRLPSGSRIEDGADLDPVGLTQAWDIAVGVSGRQAVRDVRADNLNALHPGIKATLLQSRRNGPEARVRIALTAASDQLVVLAYAAPEEDEAAHAAAWEKVLGSVRVVAAGTDWLLYLKYGGIVAGGLFLLLLGWWAVLRPRRGAKFPPRQVAGIRALDGMGMYDAEAGSSPAPGDPARARPEPAGRPEPAVGSPGGSEILAGGAEAPDAAPIFETPVPTTGADWDPETDPAFAEPAEEEDAPLRPQLGYGEVDAPKPPPPPAPETDPKASPASRPSGKETEPAGGLRIRRNQDYLT